MIWERIVAHFYFRVGSFYVICFKGRTTSQTSIGNDSQAPNVDLIGVSIIGVVFKDFWSDIVGSSTHGFSSFGFMTEFGG